MPSSEFIADFHVHSKYSRATAKDLNLESLYIAAQKKGITVVGTGDFTHPQWFDEITEKLVPGETGIFKLHPDIAAICDEKVPKACRNPVRFILAGEISNIYKKNGKTRKNHNLVFLPDLETARSFNAKLDRIGNIKSDGRPILGLDARNLLEILLETSSEGFFIPAHIWTPWFSLLGSKSGFDSLEECFEDLTPHIFAVETGLSSDPAMNWRVSNLDNLTLVSNSDAHSPFTLGREANRFNTPLSYDDIRDAMKTGDPDRFKGTLEFYPEEGKYHFDGHRKCNICYHPKMSRFKNGICPTCNKPLTLGVLHRVEELADRDEGEKPDSALPFDNIIPLTDILSDIFKVGPKSKKVATHYDQATSTLGPEFQILCKLSREKLSTSGIPLLGEAISRMRSGQVRIKPGYDGEYGVVKIFEEGERKSLMGQKSLFVMPVKETKGTVFDEKDDLVNLRPSHPEKEPIPRPTVYKDQILPFDPSTDIFSNLNPSQKEAIIHKSGPLLIWAGPGTGKTYTLTHRIAYLVKEGNVLPENILAVTFTNKAAKEMKERLTRLLKDETTSPLVATFHSLCLKILTDEIIGAKETSFSIVDDQDQKLLIKETAARVTEKNTDIAVGVNEVYNWIISAKLQILGPKDDLSVVGETKQVKLFSQVYAAYQDLLSALGVMDFEDLIFKTVHLLENNLHVRDAYRQKFKYIFVDEYQDVNHGQYRIVRALAPVDKDLCVIGDPDQSIYGFRGSDVTYFRRFLEDYPEAKMISLSHNYRSTETILEGAHQVISHQQTTNTHSNRVFSGIKGIKTLDIMASSSEKSEAVAIGKTIEKLVGGTGFHSIDFGNVHQPDKASDERSFADFAVLYRTRDQGRIIFNVLEKAGIPCQLVSRNHVFFEPGIRELISYFKLVEAIGNITDFERAIRLPGTGLGKKTIDKFKTWYFHQQMEIENALLQVRRFPLPGMDNASQLKLDIVIAEIIRLREELKGQPVDYKLLRLSQVSFISTGLRQNPKADDILLFLFNIAKEYTSATSFLNTVTLQMDADTFDALAQKVALMTMHAAKGLEFPVVFIAGCEAGFVPFLHSEDTSTDMDEERRLFYVAMTRAKEHLFLSWAKKRRIFGKTEERRLSPFVKDIEKALIKEEALSPAKKKKAQTQLKLF